MSDTPGPVSSQSILAERRRMEAAGLDVADTAADPIEQFELWYSTVIVAGVNQPDAMALATVDGTGHPEVRHVLLKGVDRRGFSFYTNYESDKARQIAGNAHVSAVFPWLQVNRQVRIGGAVEKVTPEESDDYWITRPRGSQIGAWASDQSAVIPGREQLEERRDELIVRFAEVEVPRPAHWGGYLLRPSTVEFWQGRPDRLHDRLRYRPDPASPHGSPTWIRERLSP